MQRRRRQPTARSLDVPEENIDPIYAAGITLRRYWDLDLPVDPVIIAKKMGILVYYSDDLDESSGFYDAESKAILIAEHKNKTRQRFSIAHELGHIVLGHITSAQSRQHYSVPNEQAANRFAATLLMPDLAVSTLVEQRGLGFDELCHTFDVSERAMGIRLMELGLV